MDESSDEKGHLVQNLGPLCIQPIPDQQCWTNALSKTSSQKVIRRPRIQRHLPDSVALPPSAPAVLYSCRGGVDAASKKPTIMTKYVSMWPRFGHNEYDVFVGNLESCISASTLASWFEPFANVLHARIITDHNSGQSRGFGFVTFGSEPSMNKAIRALNGTEQAGKIIRVEQSSPKVTDGCLVAFVNRKFTCPSDISLLCLSISSPISE